MQTYTKIKEVFCPKDDEEINSILDGGWVVIGIKIERKGDCDEFADYVTYILGFPSNLPELSR